MHGTYILSLNMVVVSTLDILPKISFKAQYLVMVEICAKRKDLIISRRCFWWLNMSLSLSNWYPGSGVVLDCTDS